MNHDCFPRTRLRCLPPASVLNTLAISNEDLQQKDPPPDSLMDTTPREKVSRQRNVLHCAYYSLRLTRIRLSDSIRETNLHLNHASPEFVLLRRALRIRKM